MLQETLNTIGLIWAALFTIGSAMDFFSVRYRPSIHDLLSDWWERLRVTKTPDLPSVAADRTLKALAQPLGLALRSRNPLSAENLPAGSPIETFRFSRRSFLTVLVVSLITTAVILALAPLLAVELSLSQSIHFTYVARLKFTILEIAPNLLFDSLSVFITIHVLGLIARNRGLALVPYILLELIAAVLMFFGVVMAIDLSTSLVSTFHGPLEMILLIIGGLCWAIAPSSSCAIQNGIYPLFYGATTFIPTLVYVALMVLLMIAKPIAEGGRIVSVYVLGAATDHPRDAFPVFAMCGSLMAALLSVMVVVAALLAAVRVA